MQHLSLQKSSICRMRFSNGFCAWFCYVNQVEEVTRYCWMLLAVVIVVVALCRRDHLLHCSGDHMSEKRPVLN